MVGTAPSVSTAATNPNSCCICPAVAAICVRLDGSAVPVEVDGRRFSVKVWLPDAPVVMTAWTERMSATFGDALPL